MGTKILLADDSLTIQKVVELTFAETDHDVVAVSGGQELLDALPEVAPDIVICDVVMPGTDGYEVCQVIKSSPATLHIPVILLTGTFEPFDRDRALAAGCDEIITKPFEARKLVEAVDRLTGAPSEEPVETMAEFGAPTEPVEALQPDEVTEPEAAPGLEGAEMPGAAEEVAAAPAAAAGFAAPEPEVAFAIGDEQIEDSEDALEFTTTGFAEMEAAGRRELGLPEQPEIGEPPQAEEEPPTEEPPRDEPPFGEPPAPEFEPEFGAPEAADTAEDEEPTMVSGATSDTVTEVFEEPATEGVITAPVEAPEEDAAFAAAEVSDAFEHDLPGELPAVEEAPTEEADGLPETEFEEPPAEEEPQPPVEEFAPIEEMVEASAEPDEPAWEEPPAPDLPDDEEPTAPIETAAFAPPPFEAPEAAADAVEPVQEEERAEAPEALADLPSAPEPELPTPPPIPAGPEAAAGEGMPVSPVLSDEDVERIARRVVELASERIEQIAWEVVPDMAELVVRERIRQLEAAIEADEDTVQ